MTRGKYAAKANGQRAEVAQNTAAQLRIQIEEMRREHAFEVSDLKTRIGSLEGQLIREVREMAAAEVERIRAEAHAEIEAERAQKQQAFAEIVALCRSGKRGGEFQTIMAGILGVRFGELLHNDGAPDSRHLRRLTSSDYRRAKSLGNIE